MSQTLGPGTHVAKMNCHSLFRPLYPTHELPGKLDARYYPIRGHNDNCDVVSQSLHSLWCRTGFVLSSLKLQSQRKSFFKSETLQAWKDERANPTIPPPSNIVHVVKHMRTAPELHSNWTPAQFIE